MREFGAVICNFQSYEKTMICVDNIIALKCDMEIVIVDNGSSNNSYEILSSKYCMQENCHVLKNDRPLGYSCGNNLGLRFLVSHYPSIKYLCIILPDTVFKDAQIFERMANKIELREEIAIISPIMYHNGKEALDMTCWSIPNSIQIALKQWILYKPFKKYNKNTCEIDGLMRVGVVRGSFFLAKRKAMEEIDFFDENLYLYCEETLLALRLRKRGYFEAVDTLESYYHIHPDVHGQKISLIERLQKIHKGSLRSRKYICKIYYPAWSTVLLYLISFINDLTLIAIHILSIIKRKINRRKNS